MPTENHRKVSITRFFSSTIVNNGCVVFLWLCYETTCSSSTFSLQWSSYSRYSSCFVCLYCCVPSQFFTSLSALTSPFLAEDGLEWVPLRLLSWYSFHDTVESSALLGLHFNYYNIFSLYYFIFHFEELSIIMCLLSVACALKHSCVLSVFPTKTVRVHDSLLRHANWRLTDNPPAESRVQNVCLSLGIYFKLKHKTLQINSQINT